MKLVALGALFSAGMTWGLGFVALEYAHRLGAMLAPLSAALR